MSLTGIWKAHRRRRRLRRSTRAAARRLRDEAYSRIDHELTAQEQAERSGR